MIGRLANRLINKARRILQEVNLLDAPAPSGNIEDYFERFFVHYREWCNPFLYYRSLIDDLLGMDSVAIVPLKEMMTTPDSGVRLVGLRHDIDTNPGGALKAARYLAQQGVCGSFYLLHTASYYGSSGIGGFTRHPMLTELVYRLIVAGCEIGIHNDAYWVYTKQNADGAKRLKEEIRWLRSVGADVTGTVAHNSAPVYGAENCEIFKERVLWSRDVLSPEGKTLPLGVLSEKALGIDYEGGFVVPRKCVNREDAADFCRDLESCDVRSETWMRRYLIDNPCCHRQIDYQFWLIGRDTWVAAGGHEDGLLFEWMIDWNRVMAILKGLPGGTRSVLVIHPDYIQYEWP